MPLIYDPFPNTHRTIKSINSNLGKGRVVTDAGNSFASYRYATATFIPVGVHKEGFFPRGLLESWTLMTV